MEKLISSTKVSILDSEFIVKFPTVGQLMEIESLKMRLTDNTYPEMVKSGLKSNLYNLDLVDAISHFTVLIPDMRKKLKIESISDMDAITGNMLVKAFRKQFYPWYKQFTDELYSDLDEKKEENVGA